MVQRVQGLAHAPGARISHLKHGDTTTGPSRTIPPPAACGVACGMTCAPRLAAGNAGAATLAGAGALTLLMSICRMLATASLRLPLLGQRSAPFKSAEPEIAAKVAVDGGRNSKLDSGRGCGTTCSPDVATVAAAWAFSDLTASRTAAQHADMGMRSTAGPGRSGRSVATSLGSNSVSICCSRDRAASTAYFQ